MHISVKEIWCNLDGPLKNKELWIYVVKFEFSRLKVAQKGVTGGGGGNLRQVRASLKRDMSVSGFIEVSLLENGTSEF